MWGVFMGPWKLRAPHPKGFGTIFPMTFGKFGSQISSGRPRRTKLRPKTICRSFSLSFGSSSWIFKFNKQLISIYVKTSEPLSVQLISSMIVSDIVHRQNVIHYYLMGVYNLFASCFYVYKPTPVPCVKEKTSNCCCLSLHLNRKLNQQSCWGLVMPEEEYGVSPKGCKGCLCLKHVFQSYINKTINWYKCWMWLNSNQQIVKKRPCKHSYCRMCDMVISTNIKHIPVQSSCYNNMLP